MTGRTPKPGALTKAAAVTQAQQVKRFFWHYKANFYPKIASLCHTSALRHEICSHSRIHSTPMVTDIVKYLREVAQSCTRLARSCPHSATSHGLEEVAVDLMAKAQELERQCKH